nr:hypothetical protein [Frankia gtarii]
MQPAAQGRGEPGDDVLPGDLALLDLGNPALGDAHPLGNLLLGQTPRPAHLCQPVTHRDREQFLLAGLDGVLTAGTGDLLGTDLRSSRVATHRRSV